jgi:DNA-directed RNA polymerase I, II, and III subunit RPABC2
LPSSDGYDYEEEVEPELYDEEEPQADAPQDPDQAHGDADDNVVIGGDPSAAAAAKAAEKNTVTSLKEKKVPDDKRTTTPYMTKYEKARVLGTRALQIRWDKPRPFFWKLD